MTDIITIFEEELAKENNDVNYVKNIKKDNPQLYRKKLNDFFDMIHPY